MLYLSIEQKAATTLEAAGAPLTRSREHHREKGKEVVPATPKGKGKAPSQAKSKRRQWSPRLKGQKPLALAMEAAKK